jgi:2-methylisocitrate lyase-like PEP mutase family enzyme
MAGRTSLRALLDAGTFIVAPGVYDGISTRFAAQHGFDALYMTGHGVSASQAGLPDVGLATYSDMLRGVSLITSITDIPLIADADTGYGGLLNVQHTVRGYEAAGAQAIQLEDQEFPKKCGHTPGKRVIPGEEMAKKLRVAVDSRDSRDTLIIARTDARALEGLDGAFRRAELYLEAGADILFIEAPESEEEMAEIGRRFGVPLLANMAEGTMTPMVSTERLEELGYRIAIFPGTAFFAAAEAMRQVYAHVAATRSTFGTDVPLMDFGDWCRQTGFPAVWDFDKKHAD